MASAGAERKLPPTALKGGHGERLQTQQAPSAQAKQAMVPPSGANFLHSDQHLLMRGVLLLLEPPDRLADVPTAFRTTCSAVQGAV